jgi:hypothetical protein
MGSVDVALETATVRIACEISVTTSPEHEAGNVQKCLAAGFDHVAVVSAERKSLSRLRDVINQEVGEHHRDRVRYLTPEDLFAFLEEIEAHAASTGGTVRGYKVKVQYKPVDEAAKKGRRQAVGQVILQALRRLKRE